MIVVSFAPSFLRQVKVLQPEVQEMIIDVIERFKDGKNHKALKVHKLHGRLQDRFSFSADYRLRIIFIYGESKQEVTLLAVGSHDVYK